MASPRVGILALQGDFHRHREALQWLGVETRLVRETGELDGCTHLILPGGETTTITRLLGANGLRDALLDFGRARPVWGTCAGMILVAREVNDAHVKTLDLLDITVARNAYGRQVDSFTTEIDLGPIGPDKPFHAVFIRAPKLTAHGPSVTPLASVNGEIVLARDERVLVSAFHPELTPDPRLHQYFLQQF